jgi:hypothetical protein
MKNATQFAIIGTTILLFIQIYSYFVTNFGDYVNLNHQIIIISFKVIFFFQLLAYISILNFFICFKKNIIDKDETNEIGKQNN